MFPQSKATNLFKHLSISRLLYKKETNFYPIKSGISNTLRQSICYSSLTYKLAIVIHSNLKTNIYHVSYILDTVFTVIYLSQKP